VIGTYECFEKNAFESNMFAGFGLTKYAEQRELIGFEKHSNNGESKIFPFALLSLFLI
jgi:hypothetical protein